MSKSRAPRWADHQQRRSEAKRRCAICYVPPEFRHLPREQRLLRRGDLQSDWLCDRCFHARENYRWKKAPVEERRANDEVDAVESGSAVELATGRGPYENKLAVEIMRLYCLHDWTHARIAEQAGCSRQMVSSVIAYWTTERGWFVDHLRTSLRNRKRPA
jgi:hypothetical protein